MPFAPPTPTKESNAIRNYNSALAIGQHISSDVGLLARVLGWLARTKQHININ
jgi:hypothetical protein